MAINPDEARKVLGGADWTSSAGGRTSRRRMSRDEIYAQIGERPPKQEGESIQSYNRRLGKWQRQFGNMASGFSAKERAAAAQAIAAAGGSEEQQQWAWWNGPSEDVPGYTSPAAPPPAAPPVNTDRPDLPQPGQSTTITALTDRPTRQQPAPAPTPQAPPPPPQPVEPPMTRPRPTLNPGSMGVGGVMQPQAQAQPQRRFGSIGGSAAPVPGRLRYR